MARHLQSMPQYHVGHLERVADIEAHVRRLPGLALAGNAQGGVSIPASIRSAETAAPTLLAYLTTTR
jgi:protoporphyrinogen/coproporphyrinogen III oxidase